MTFARIVDRENGERKKAIYILTRPDYNMSFRRLLEKERDEMEEGK